MSVVELSPSINDSATLALVDELFTDARREKRKLLDRWGRYWRMVRNRMWCVDEQTQALTKRGWLGYDELSKDDEILACRPDGGLEWSPVLGIYRSHYRGPMVRILNRNLDALVTPEHKWLMEDGSLVATSDLTMKSRLRYMGEAEEGPAESEYSDVFVELVGWTLTEGHYLKNKTGNIEIVIVQREGETADQIRLVLKESGARFRERTHIASGPGNPTQAFFVNGEVRDAVVRVAPNKVPTHEFLLSLTSSQRRLLIDAMAAGDGSVQPDGRRAFYQTNKERVDAFLLLCSLEGIATSTVLRPLSKYPSHFGGDNYSVNLKRRKVSPVRWPMRTEHYEGTVWCPQTTCGSFVARRGAKVYVTGNSEYRSAWLPSPSSSELFPTYATLVAWMTDQKPNSFVSPHPDLDDLEGTPLITDVLDQMSEDMEDVLNSWWITQGITNELQMALWDTFTFGAGILRSGFDDTAAEGLGEGTLRRVDPYAILPDPNASSLHDARYIMEVRRIPFFELKSRYPERADWVPLDTDREGKDDRRPREGYFQYRPMANPAATGVTGEFPGTPTIGIPPLYGPPGHTPDDYTKTVLLKECWLRSTRRVEIPVIEEGERRISITQDIPYWEYVATANGVVLTPDTSNPFDHGQCPYVRIPCAEVGEFWSISLSEHLAPAQIALNRLLAAMQINAELVGNPILLNPTHSGLSRTKIINRPGTKLDVTDQAVSQVKWLPPPTMPDAVNKLTEFWRGTIDRISGISAVARGGSMRRREPAEAVDAVQEASFVRIRAVLRNMEESLQVSLNQIASNAVQFYNQPRSVPLVGPSGSVHFKKLKAHHFDYPLVDQETNQIVGRSPMRFFVSVQAGSSLPMSRQARSAEADSLYFMQTIDDEAVLEAHEWPNRDQILKRVKEKKAKGEMGGTPPSPRRKR